MPGLGLGDPPEEPRGRVPVHYQISITGRQAASFFLLLLACLGLSFFFGMKTGAGAHRGPGSAAAVIASASDIPVPTLAPAEGLREEKKPADEALGTRPEERKAAAVEEKETRDSRKAAESAPAAVPTAAPTAAPPNPTAAPVSTPKPVAPKPAAKPVPKGPFYVQVLATKSATTADELAKRLKGEGFAADVAAVPGKPGLFRVHVGPFKDRAKAGAVARKIKATDKQIKKLPLVVP